MRKTVAPIHSTLPIVNRNSGLMTETFRLYALGLELNGIMIGDGSPETNIEAEQGQRYMDQAATPGVDPILYIKHQADIGGDKKQGWIAIG